MATLSSGRSQNFNFDMRWFFSYIRLPWLKTFMISWSCSFVVSSIFTLSPAFLFSHASLSFFTCSFCEIQPSLYSKPLHFLPNNSPRFLLSSLFRYSSSSLLWNLLSVGCGALLSSWFKGIYFLLCLYPMKDLHHGIMYTPPRGGVQRGVTPSMGSGRHVGPQRGFEDEAPEWKIAL
jgi:hypothetical protein